MIENPLDCTPTPRRLIQSLLSAPSLQNAEVGLFIKWGNLFGITPSATRMAVARLVRDGFIVAQERGNYTLGPDGELVAEAAGRWSTAEDRIVTWNKGWLAVHTSHLGRSNKTTLRNRERAFRLRGFMELVTGLWCRPDNYFQSTGDTLAELVSLGLEPTAILLKTTEISGPEETRLFKLWPREELEERYQQMSRAMADSTRRIGGMSNEDAARETFLVGEAVIRSINADPLLPAEMVDAGARREMIESMIKYNELGRSIWKEFQLHSD